MAKLCKAKPPSGRPLERPGAQKFVARDRVAALARGRRRLPGTLGQRAGARRAHLVFRRNYRGTLFSRRDPGVAAPVLLPSTGGSFCLDALFNCSFPVTAPPKASAPLLFISATVLLAVCNNNKEGVPVPFSFKNINGFFNLEYHISQRKFQK